MPKYVVLQVVLKEALIGTGSNSRTLSKLEDVINEQCSKGYRLHTITTTSSGSGGLLGGDRIQATLVFESLDISSPSSQSAPQTIIQQPATVPEKKKTLADFDL